MMAGQSHLSDTFLNSKRLAADPEADHFIEEVFKDAGQKKMLQLWMKNATVNTEINDLIKQFPGIDFIAGARRLPEWGNPRLMKNGAVFFSRHSESIMSLLGLLSLPYCYTAANGAMVLYLSEKIRRETTMRLYETAVFVWEMMAPDAFDAGGKAFSEILKVRLMHAAVRYYTLQSGKWDEAWGLPINQEDMAGTNLSFSLIVIRGLRLLGFSVNQNDQESFLHLWNVIGYLMGLDQDLIAKEPRMAQQLDRAISKRQFRTSVHGQELTASLTGHILSINNTKATENDILGLMRYLLGTEVANQLGIVAPGLPAYKLSLIRTVNLLKSFRPQGDPQRAYSTAYQAFRLKNTF